MDRAWWTTYLAEVRQHFPGERMSPVNNCPGVTRMQFNHYRNSGAGAISLAVHLGAQRVILLGYDAQKTSGRSHWHGNHPAGLGNAGSVGKWPAQFREIANNMRGVEIINSSRATALTCFPQTPLEAALA